MNISMRDKKLLLMFSGVAVFGLGWFFGYRPQMEEAANIEAANKPLEERLSNLLELCVQYREENYTQDNWSIYSEKKQAAEALLQKLSVTEIVAEKEESEDTAADISQAEIDAAAAELYSAMKGLVKIQKENLADKTGLQNLYEMTGILSESDYTAESWEKLVKAQEAAKVVLDSELADQQKTDEAANALIQAAKELVREEEIGRAHV